MSEPIMGLKSMKIIKNILRLNIALVCSVFASAVFASENAIQSVTANQQGANVIIKVVLQKPLSKEPIGFSITNPSRIALDFPDTSNATGKTTQDIGLGDVRSVNLVQAGERSRLVFNLGRPLNYATSIEGNVLVVAINGSGGVATPVTAAGLPAADVKPVLPAKQAIKDIDFRRGSGGEGRVVVDLPGNQVAVDVRQQGKTIIADFVKTSLPDVLRRRLDVADYGTPVSIITTTSQG